MHACNACHDRREMLFYQKEFVFHPFRKFEHILYKGMLSWARFVFNHM